MKVYFRNLIKELRNPDHANSAYFIGKSHLLFITVGSVTIILTGMYPLFDHFFPATDDSTSCNVCTIVHLINICSVLFLIMSLSFFCTRLYYSLWKGKIISLEVLIQIMIVLILFSAFTEMFTLPTRFISHRSEMIVAIGNLIALAGFLFAGLISFKLLRIVNANLKFYLKK